MALYEVTLTQSYYGQEVVNRFNYQMTGTPAAVTGSYALTSALGAIYDQGAVPPAYPGNTLIKYLADIQSTDVTFTGITVRELWNPVDFYSTPFQPTLTGQLSGEALSPALAYGFYTNRVRTDVRRGMKRFVGVSANYTSTGGKIDPGVYTALTDTAGKLGAVLTYTDEGQVLSFTPGIFGKERYAVPNSNPVRYAYRYYGNETDQIAHSAIGVIWSFYPEVRTQTSRQYGRGN